MIDNVLVPQIYTHIDIESDIDESAPISRRREEKMNFHSVIIKMSRKPHHQKQTLP